MISPMSSPDSLKIMPGVVTVVGRTRDEAQEKFDKLQALIHPELGVAALSDIVGLDLTYQPQRRFLALRGGSPGEPMVSGGTIRFTSRRMFWNGPG